MICFVRRALALFSISIAGLAFSLGATAAEVDPAQDPSILLAMMKAAVGGPALDTLMSRHVVWRMTANGLKGTADQWDELATGRSYGTYKLGLLSGGQGFDGNVLWTQDESGASRVETSRDAAEASVSAAFRTSMAQWFPARRRGAVEYARSENRGDTDYYVLRVSPQDGRAYELWVNRKTNLVERLAEREGAVTRVETYADYRDVSGIRMPFSVLISRGDTRYDQLFAMESVEFNVPLDKTRFARPGRAANDYAFPSGKTSVEVPFRLLNGHVYLLVKLNGKGPFLMLVGSASASVLQPDVATSLGVTVEGGAAGAGAGVTKIDSVDIGGIILRDQIFSTLDLQDFASRVDGVDAFGGLMGYELFKRFPIKIDYERSVATLYDPASFKYAGTGTRVPFHFRNHTPEIDGTIDGIQASFAVDLGSAPSLDLAGSFVDKHDLAVRYSSATHVVSSSGIDGRAYALLARPATLDLGGVTFARPVAYLSQGKASALDDGPAGTVGYGVLRQFTVTFDYATQQAYFEKNAGYGRPDVADRSGLWVERTARGYEIIDVVDGGPADQAGLMSGDIIKSVDGKSTETLSLADLRARFKSAPATRIKLVLGGIKPRPLELVLRDLI